MNHYEVLGIRKTATQNEIKSAYKKLVKKYHPDIYPGDKSYAELKIKEINSAYEVLSNPTLKQEYDNALNPTPTYSYTPPKYNETSSSKYSYDNYKKNYNNSSYYNQSTYSDYNYSKTSNYNYTSNNQKNSSTSNYKNDAQKRYTDYHRSKTPRSNYSNPNSKDFTDNVINGFDKMTQKEKFTVIFLFVIAYLIFILVNIFQLSELLNSGKENTSNKIPYTQSTNTQTNYYKNTSSNVNNTTSNKFNINDYFTDSQLREVYNSYYKDKYTFKEFKDIISKAYEEYYY